MKNVILKIWVLLVAILLSCGMASAGELSKVVVVDKMEVLSSGHVQVREAVRAMQDAKIISQQFHRYVVSPGDDYSKCDVRVKAVCEKVHTPAVIEAYLNSISENPTKDTVTPGLVKETRVGKVHILEDGSLVVERVTQVLDDGMAIGTSKVLEKVVPGTDVSKEATLVKDIAEVIQTQDVIDAYNASIIK